MEGATAGLTTPAGFHLRTRPQNTTKAYRAIVQLLADPHASLNQIAKVNRISTHNDSLLDGNPPL